jgi:HEAT repeats
VTLPATPRSHQRVRVGTEMPRKRTSGGEKFCFVLMPFSAEFDAVYESAIRPGVASSGHFSCSRADDVFGPRPIMADVWRSIQRADLVLADLTGRNPNVLYELGLAHAIQKPAILISQSMDDVPFDLRGIRCLVYRSDRHLRDDLKERLAAAIREYLLDSEDSSERLTDYIVFSPVTGTSLKEPAQEEIVDIDDPDPAKQLNALRSLKDASRTFSPDQPISPSIALSVAKHLDSSHPEVQIAAIECLGRLKAKAYAHKLYPLIELPNPVVQIAAIEAITNLHDRNAEDILIRVLDSKPKHSVKKQIVEALSRVGYELSTAYFSKTLSDVPNNANQEGVGIAIEVLCGIDTFESLSSVLSIGLSRLNVANKSLLAKGLGEAELLWFHQDTVAEILDHLIEDTDPTVRGAALAAWCIRSNSEWGGELPRQAFWEKVRASDKRTIRALFAGLVTYDNPFVNGEGRELVNVGERMPDLGSQVVYYLSQIGGPEASAFMKKWFPQERLWVLGYFARFPSFDAEAECKMEVRGESDINRKFLAMVCLARLGSRDAADNVRKIVGKESLHHWVRKYALPVLRNLAGDAGPGSRRSLNKLIGEIESE